MRSPNQPVGIAHLCGLGAAYGVSWSAAYLVILGVATGELTPPLGNPYEILCLAVSTVLTCVTMTLLTARWLPRFGTWIVVPVGLFSLPLGVALWTSLSLFQLWIFGAPQPDIQAVRHDLGDLVEMFKKWYPDTLVWMLMLSVMTIVPIPLAVLNCWDLRRRMLQASHGADVQP
ncbi:MAG: hypothetical protein EBR95_05310 [Verrucomicrobia bacterium]|nr:hypothetical protein [Verrucomicrobiota bacterium]